MVGHCETLGICSVSLMKEEWGNHKLNFSTGKGDGSLRRP